MSLPASHPAVHDHKGKTCPVTGETHGFCPPQEGDSRSVCPALNVMANHGYISRDGKNLSAGDITRGLKECYGLSSPLAYFLAYVGFMIIRKFARRVSLFEIGKHNAVEHDASLVHHDTPQGSKYAPIEIDQKLVDDLIDDVRPTHKDFADAAEPGERFLLNFEDVARARVRREAECRPIDSVHAEIARGEMAIILGVWDVKGKQKSGIPVDYFRRWISEERMPDGWKPDHVQSLRDVVARSKQIRTHVAFLRGDGGKQAPPAPAPAAAIEATSSPISEKV
ncbi:Cloroperoxidase [Pholiota conissans]|uniref:Cloroperoxidase n=1 Tax=Pholiota conissans TaxID=109636 RepID=A0A9P5Z4K2_9AGAR|nr:Cloroperoxidase [Pholiota conissans]